MKKQIAINRKNWKVAWRMARCPDLYLADNSACIPCGSSLLFLAIKVLETRTGVRQ